MSDIQWQRRELPWRPSALRRARPTISVPITLTRPAFVCALALLLANDLLLKSAYPGWLTGKLSDFAGLFVLPYFLAWLWPARRGALHVGVALAFVAWKLPLSRPFVDLWNAAPWFDIARVEDLTDLLALPSVWLSWRTTILASRRLVHLPSLAIATVALVAFTATSQTRSVAPLRGSYLYEGTPSDLAETLRRARIKVDAGTRDGWVLALQAPRDPLHQCADEYSVDARVTRFRSATLLELRQITSHCSGAGEINVLIAHLNSQFLPLGLQLGQAAAVPDDQ